MKKVVISFLACLIALLSVSLGFASNTEICDGFVLGMLKEEAVINALSKGLSINSWGVYETTVVNQPFSVVELYFIENLSNFEPVRLSSYDAVPADIFSDWKLSGPEGGNNDLFSAETEAGWFLAQVSVLITSDYKYDTAVETFGIVEELLNQQYGVTRYTSRRGEALPMVDGYNLLTRFVITRDIPERHLTVPDYSQRIVPLPDGRYMAIDHHISMRRENGGNTFRHFLIYSLIPVDISDPANLTEKSEKEPEVNEIAAPVVQTPVPEITADTILYYNPSGGEYYHLDQNCRRINERYLPLKGSFRYSELNDKANGFSRLKPCEICGAPAPAPAQKEDVVTEYDTGGL